MLSRPYCLSKQQHSPCFHHIPKNETAEISSQSSDISIRTKDGGFYLAQQQHSFRLDRIARSQAVEVHSGGELRCIPRGRVNSRQFPLPANRFSIFGRRRLKSIKESNAPVSSAVPKRGEDEEGGRSEDGGLVERSADGAVVSQMRIASETNGGAATTGNFLKALRSSNRDARELP